MADLPDVALHQLGCLFKQSIASLKVSVQELLNVLGLLGKKHGGSRTIAIMASFYRALMKFFCPRIREWDLKESHFWDSALSGSSSLRAAVLRALRVENGVGRGAWIGHLLWDMAKFYDSVHLPTLCNELAKREFPKALLVVGFFVHVRLACLGWASVSNQCSTAARAQCLLGVRSL